jgi:hypothetical protein
MATRIVDGSLTTRPCERLFRGNESEHYLEDASNITVEDLEWFIDGDPSLASVFRGEHGAACERDGPSDPWRRAEDFHPHDED